ncbi:Putative Zn-dependent peptidase [Kitasatospora sp. MMS16-BH015]|uniref:M16 family metallopeptidase n=1 Tax=Kitasatospora sp. MMS16-BH015 TaxID=2018025 RepID=UPI000CA0C0BA|nr:pitrilysin family protein [Kitasatospora sp. MMS16-BH015]AUG81633.1 Putative Zn-dependent peptidase [Kitasatospora sp. MMS16-BH015]
MTGTATIARPGVLRRHRLANGLRLVVLPDADSPAVGLAVAYGVGYRSESRSGFAHLFEHLMFQGSANLEAQEHARLIQANGGVFNGTTHRDHTSYFQAMPAEALELGLFLEADRMRAPRITPEAIATQASVVAEEIRRTVSNRPYGGFPTFQLPQVLFSSFANTHDGYGDHASLAAATVEECESFFERHYAPGNAVLAVCGGVEPEQVIDLAERHFGSIPTRRTAPAARIAEPPLATPRTVERTDRLAPLPALAVGRRMPPPDSPDHLPTVVAAAVLGDGEAGRLHRSLVRERRLASQVMAMAGLSGPFDSRDPDAFLITAVCPPGIPVRSTAAAVEEELATLAAEGPAEAELQRVVSRLQTAWYTDIDPVGVRARRLAGYELLHGDGELVLDGPYRFAAVGPEDVRRAAGELARSHPAVLHLTPERKAAPVDTVTPERRAER